MNEPDDSSPGDTTPTSPAHEPLRNTLYRRVTKGRRKLTSARVLLYRVAVAIAWATIRALWATCRVTHVAGLEGARRAVRDSRSLIPVYWHQHMLFGARAVLDLRSEGLRAGFLISPSVDGTAPAMLVEKVGGVVIRGSSTHTGARALRDFYETVVKQHVSPAITPDGPKGPLHEFKPGAILLSQITGKPILPVAVAASHACTFRTWDAFELPLPFSRIAIVYGEPVKVGRTPDTAALEQWQAKMAESLSALRRQAERALHGA
ncbi:MAG TPA: lysophospholipid acyltransferase family protein [Steroidobacteraceae bacterium]|nr:lysophospholipid acyltransferase family protein [Steroidobacteraceae bacterium]